MTINAANRQVKNAWVSEVSDKLSEVKPSSSPPPFGKAAPGHEIKEFAETTTAHGLRNTVSENSSRFRRCAWLLAFIAALTYLGYQLVECSIDYYRYPIKGESRLTRMNTMEFPTMTICNLNIADANKAENPQAIKDILRVGTKCMWPEVLDTNLDKMLQDPVYAPYLNRKYKDLMMEIAPGISDTFKYCMWNGVGHPCEELLTPVYTMSGRCFQLNIKATSPLVATRAGSNGGFFAALKTTLEGYTVSGQNAYGFKIFLHRMYDLPDVLSQGYLLSPGFSYHVGFTAETIKYLPHPYKSQGDMYCEEYSKHDGTGDLFDAIFTGHHSLTGCVYSRACHEATKLCGCNLFNCTLYEELKCYEPTFKRIYDEATKTDLLGCAIPCTIQSYRPVLSQAAFPSPDMADLLKLMMSNETMDGKMMMGLALFFEDLIMREQLHEPVYNSLSLMGMLGGNMGLLLGASLLTIAELIEFIMFLVWRLAYKNTGSPAPGSRDPIRESIESWAAPTKFADTIEPSPKEDENRISVTRSGERGESRSRSAESGGFLTTPTAEFNRGSSTVDKTPTSFAKFNTPPR